MKSLSKSKMAGLAVIFPGQGSQAPGMGQAAAEEYPEARQVFEQADAALGFALSRVCFEGPEEELRRTAVTQPAILTTSIALWAVLHKRGVRPVMVAGHSLGEYSAIVAAGGLSLADAVTTVQMRGQFMQEAVPEGQGAMAAVVGLEPEQVEQLCAESAAGQVLTPANFNAPGQIVVSGHAEAVERAVEGAAKLGALRAVRLPVSAPFHCPLMLPAQEKLQAHLEGLPFQDLEVPLVTNVDAEPVQSAAQVRDALIRQVSSPVRWAPSMQRAIHAGAARFLEVGPGKVLAGLQRRIERATSCTPVSDPKGVKRALETLCQEEAT
jgi:[acyl-carrier-protein] S-malonyltransferase